MYHKPKMAADFGIASRGNIREAFIEADEVMKLIDSLETDLENKIKIERTVERLTFVFDQYQEQPHLLDPHMESMIDHVIDKIRQHRENAKLLHLLNRTLYFITKTRGYKVVIRWLPHEVSDLEVVLGLLTIQSPTNRKEWENRYCLLLWLSIVAMIPFDLIRLDNKDSGDDKLPIMTRILEAAKQHLLVSDKACDAAAYMMAKFLTRPDVKDMKMLDTVDWAIKELEAHDTTAERTTVSIGILKMLSQLFKLGKREDLLPYASKILKSLVSNEKLRECDNTIIRKLITKLTQRIGLVYLKAKVASWRYTRGSRSLASNLPSSNPNSQASSSLPQGAGSFQSTTLHTTDSDEYDIPDELEDIIEFLLTNLKDKDSIVRWSAAKGIGRVTGRLPEELANDIIESLLEFFSISETDSAWHGACLALAELGRRGLLLTTRLPDVIPVVLKSLVYDEKKGICSVGSHVRDAACYICWSFARAYEPDDLKPYVQQIASALVVVSVFDREVNVRRAAAAAFQENVGRQGTFPHGIDILTTCDYHAVGLRNTSYLELSSFVAQFSEYRQALVDHLIEFKLSHWDPEIRKLASQALHNLIVVDIEQNNRLLSRLAGLATGTDLNTRHGCILAIGQVCTAIANHVKSEIHTQIEDSVLCDILDIDNKLKSRQMLLGLGGEFMKKALSSMISDIASAKLQVVKYPQVLDRWYSLQLECIASAEPEIQALSISAMSCYVNFYTDQNGNVQPEIREKVIQDVIKAAQKPQHEVMRIGMIKVLGSLPKSALEGHIPQILDHLINMSLKQDNEHKDWAESRKQTFQTLEAMITTVGITSDEDTTSSISFECIETIVSAYSKGLSDYTIDDRGDIGAFVREAAMSGISSLLKTLAKLNPELIKPEIVHKVMPILAQQACEKIDRTRRKAGECFTELLHFEPTIPHIPARKKLESLFPPTHVRFMNFAAPRQTFWKFVYLLDTEEYRYHVLLGFTVSVGGLTESLVKHSHKALLEFLKEDIPGVLDSLCQTIIKIYKDFIKNDRVTIPLLKMTDQLLSGGELEQVLADTESTFASDLFECVKAEIKGSGNPQKLLNSINVICALIEGCEAIREKCLFQIAIFLCHRFPRIRKAAASQLFESLIATEDAIAPENYDRVLSIISDTQWDIAVDQIKPLRNELCDLLKIKTPQPLKKPTTTT